MRGTVAVPVSAYWLHQPRSNRFRQCHGERLITSTKCEAALDFQPLHSLILAKYVWCCQPWRWSLCRNFQDCCLLPPSSLPSIWFCWYCPLKDWWCLLQGFLLDPLLFILFALEGRVFSSSWPAITCRQMTSHLSSSLTPLILLMRFWVWPHVSLTEIMGHVWRNLSCSNKCYSHMAPLMMILYLLQEPTGWKMFILEWIKSFSKTFSCFTILGALLSVLFVLW